MGFHHICLRPPKFECDFGIQAITMATASALLFMSAIRQHQLSVDAGVPPGSPVLYYLWMLLFGVLLAISAWRMLRPHTQSTRDRGTWAESLQPVRSHRAHQPQQWPHARAPARPRRDMEVSRMYACPFKAM